MTETRIDQLAIHADGLAPELGERLAVQIAQALARAGGLPEWGDVPIVQVEVAAPATDHPTEWADRVATEIQRQLRALSGA